MDLNSGELITWCLKFENRHGVVFHDADWIAGADCNDNDKDREDDQERHHEEAQDDQRKEELKEGEQTDPNEVSDIISDARENDNPVMHEEEQQPHDQEDANPASDADEESKALAESTGGSN